MISRFVVTRRWVAMFAALLCALPVAGGAEVENASEQANSIFAYEYASRDEQHLNPDAQARVLRETGLAGYRGPIGVQLWGIPGDVKLNLLHSIAGWRQISGPDDQPRKPH